MASSPSPTHGGPNLDAALAHCAEKAANEGIPLHEALKLLGPASFCFVCLLLSVPFMQPMSLGPLTMASGVTFMVCGWQMTRGYTSPHLPKAFQNMRLHGKHWVGILGFCQKILRTLRRFSRPRHEKWVSGKRGEIIVGWLILCGGFLLVIPAANLPFNNTLPALMIMFAALAWLERDGLLIFVSLFWGLLTLVYFIMVGGLILLLLQQSWHWIIGAWEWIKNLFISIAL